MPNIKVKKNEDTPESVELLASSIVQVSEAFERIEKSPLKQRTIIVLLHDAIGQGKITKTQIMLVLDSLPRLRSWYLKD